MTILEIIALVDTDMRSGNAYGPDIKRQWINEVDGSIWNDIYKYTKTTDIMRQNGVSAYALPSGVDFNKVTKVYVDGDEVKKISADQKDTTGYFRGEDGKLNIYPVPTANDVTAGLSVGHLIPFTPHSTDSETPFAEAPFDRMYYEYLCAKIDLFQQDYDNYNAMMDQFNETMKEYAAAWKKGA